MNIITEPKTYTGKDLENIFFRPMFSGDDANKLGIRVLYNAPVPTTLHFWRGASNILQRYAKGWTGGPSSQKTVKTIDLQKVKAEMGYSASDYFNMVWERLTGRTDINLDDLGGTELEEAETRLFMDSVAESVRATMWLGDMSRTNGQFNTFNGFITRMVNDIAFNVNNLVAITPDDEAKGEAILRQVWDEAPIMLKEFKSQGELVFFVTSDIYAEYEDSLDNAACDAAHLAKQQGRPSLSYRGIPVVDMQISNYMSIAPNSLKSIALLTDRRNLALAVNTADFPGTEVRMWYNPDQMENRQRAVFMAGCDYLLPELISIAAKS